MSGTPIKPCPVCGCKQSSVTLHEDGYFRYCRCCDISTGASETKADATRKWNDRRSEAERVAERKVRHDEYVAYLKERAR